ncbi:MAG: hypothetical protein E6929_12525 [Clostridium sp.]|nr:hypothetical protein [Clostridium sp.]
MKSQGKGVCIVTKVLNISAIVMGIFAVFNTYASYKHIADLISKGLKVKDQLMEVINYYIASIAPYVFYGLVLYGLAIIIKQNYKRIENNNSLLSIPSEGRVNEEDDLVDELLSGK